MVLRDVQVVLQFVNPGVEVLSGFVELEAVELGVFQLLNVASV